MFLSLLLGTKTRPKALGIYKAIFRVLKARLRVKGQALVFLQGNILEVFDQLLKTFEINAIYAHQETGNAWTYARDISVRSWRVYVA